MKYTDPDQDRLKHTASKIATQLSIQSNDAYRGLDGANTIGQWQHYVIKDIKRKQAANTVPPGDAHDQLTLVQYLQECCAPNRTHCDSFCYLPEKDTDNLVNMTNRTTIPLAKPPIYNSCTRDWEPRQAVILAVRQHSNYIGTPIVDLSLFPYTKLGHGQLTFLHHDFYENQFQTILEQGISPTNVEDKANIKI